MPVDKPQSSEIFLQELKDQLQRNVGIKNGLDSKASRLIATAGTISVIFVGFGSFVITGIKPSEDVWTMLSAAVLIFEVAITVIAIMLASHAYKTREYIQPIVYYNLFDHKNNEINGEAVRQFKTADPDDLYEHFTHEYILAIKSYQENIVLQTKDIEHAQRVFYAALISIPFFVGLVAFYGAVLG